MLLRKFEELVASWRDGDVLQMQGYGSSEWKDIDLKPQEVVYENLILNEFQIKGNNLYTAFDLAGCYLVKHGLYIHIGSNDYNIEEYHKQGWKYVDHPANITTEKEWRSLQR